MSTPNFDPAAIARDSFAIIRGELQSLGYAFDTDQAAIIERIIHSTADFDFAKITRFSPTAIETGILALQQGCAVITDVNMIRVGVSKRRVATLGGSLHCFVADDETRRRATDERTTRSAMGIKIAAERELLAGGVVVIGNAPTALYEVMRLIDDGIKPALIIGVPVGFVSTVESKAALLKVTSVPWITTIGRKGGSPVAVAIINAFLRLAMDADATEVER